MEHAKEIIFAEDGVRVSLEAKNKDLLKFGRNQLIGTSLATVQAQPVGVLHETYVDSNLITSIISTSANDTESVTVEGHTSPDGLVFTFSTQTLNLTGQTAATLATPLARVTRLYNADSTELEGVISVTENDTYTSGVPDTDTKVHLQVLAGEQQSDKASTTLSSVDYWVLTGFYADVLKKSASSAEIHLSVRRSGKVFRKQIQVSASNNHRGEHIFTPYLIVYPNSDIRLEAAADGASTDVSGGMQGALLTT